MTTDQPVPLDQLAGRLDQLAQHPNAAGGPAVSTAIGAYRYAAGMIRAALSAEPEPKHPEYVALYEPAGTLANVLTGGDRTAVLARRTETATGVPYYRPVMRGKLEDVALLVEQLAEVEQRGQLGPIDPDPPELEPIPLDEDEAEPIETPEQSAAIVDRNLRDAGRAGLVTP